MKRKPSHSSRTPEAIPFQRRSSQAAKPAAPPPSQSWVEPTWVRARLEENTNSFRLTSSPLAWLECFGSDLLLSWKTDSAREALLQECQARLLAPSGPYAPDLKPPARIFGRHLARAAQERLAPVLLVGDSKLPLETEVQEAGTRYGIDFPLATRWDSFWIKG